MSFKKSVSGFTASALFTSSTLMAPLAHAASVLTLKDYISQVVTQNQTYKANDLLLHAYSLRMAEASLDFMPQLVGGASYEDNRAPVLNSLSGYETVTESANLGVQTKLRTGTQLGFNYVTAFNKISATPLSFNGTTIPLYPADGYYTSSPTVTITQPLWKDFNAALSKANEESIRANYNSQIEQTRYAMEQISFNAENAYWQLALTKQTVAFDKESIVRTTKIFQWNQKRVSMNVADRSDLLQSQAALKAKELTLQTDEELLREAALTFNSIRNVRGDQVDDELQSPDAYFETEASKELKRLRDRADVIAQQHNAESQKQSALLNKEKVKPDVSLFGSAAFNSLNENANYAFGESVNPDNPIYIAGIKFTIPLDQGTVSRINEGYEATAKAAAIVADRARYDLDQDWVNLQNRFKDALDRLDTAKELEKLQGEKLEHERDRFKTGRTTSFQVLTFEDDFSASQLSRLRVENEIITLRAQARLYNGDAK